MMLKMEDFQTIEAAWSQYPIQDADSKQTFAAGALVGAMVIMQRLVEAGDEDVNAIRGHDITKAIDKALHEIQVFGDTAHREK